MIPIITQDAPNIAAQHWCRNCGRYLLPHRTHEKNDGFSFCPTCGAHIEWKKVVPIRWEPMNCDICGVPMLIDKGDYILSTGNYVGTTTCRSCMAEYCAQTNCFGCKRGTYPNCKYKYLKPLIISEEDR